MSDHKFVMVNLRQMLNKRGPGYWKLYTAHLDDSEYTAGIKTIISSVEENPHELSARMLWELLKIEIKHFSVQFSRLRAKNKKTLIFLKIENTNPMHIQYIFDIDNSQKQIAICYLDRSV